MVGRLVWLVCVLVLFCIVGSCFVVCVFVVRVLSVVMYSVWKMLCNGCGVGVVFFLVCWINDMLMFVLLVCEWLFGWGVGGWGCCVMVGVG